MILLLSVLMIGLQERPSIPELIRNVDGQDVAATFRAIDALADLDSKHRAEIEKAAASLPEFYRDALLAELKTPAPTPRVTSAGGPRKTVLHLIEWGRQTGFAVRNYEEGGDLGTLIEAPFESVHGLEALARICSIGNLLGRQEPCRADYVFGETRRGGVFGHRSAAVLLHESSVRRRIDFSGPSPWIVNLNFEALIGPKIRTIEWSRIRVYEAAGDDGVKLEPARPANRSIIEDSVQGGRRFDRYDPKLNVALAVPADVSQIERLRFSATGLIALKERTLEVSGKPGKQIVDGLEIEVGPVRERGRGFKSLSVKLGARDPGTRKILEALASIELEFKDAKGHTSVWDGLAQGETVEFEAAWQFDIRQMVNEPCRCRGCCSCFHFKDEEVEAALPKGQPDRIRIVLPDGIEERTLFAEFRGIHIWRGGPRAGRVAPLK